MAADLAAGEVDFGADPPAFGAAGEDGAAFGRGFAEAGLAEASFGGDFGEAGLAEAFVSRSRTGVGAAFGADLAPFGADCAAVFGADFGADVAPGCAFVRALAAAFGADLVEAVSAGFADLAGAADFCFGAFEFIATSGRSFGREE